MSLLGRDEFGLLLPDFFGCRATVVAGMKGLGALARRASRGRNALIVRGGGGGPLARSEPPSAPLAEQDELYVWDLFFKDLGYLPDSYYLLIMSTIYLFKPLFLFCCCSGSGTTALPTLNRLLTNLTWCLPKQH